MNKIISLPVIKYVLLSAVRDRILLAIFLVIFLGISLSVFFGGAALTEKQDFIVVYAAGGVRIAGILGVVLFIVFNVRRAFDSKDVDFLLSRPITRTSFILSHFSAFSFIAALVALLCAGAVFPFASSIENNAYALWTVSLVLEFILVACAAMFFSMVIASASAGALVTAAFYVLSRLIGQLINIISAEKVVYIKNAPLRETMEGIMQTVSLFIPRLDLMGQTSWLVYGVEGRGDFLFIFYHALVFIGLLLSATIIDLLKREF